MPPSQDLSDRLRISEPPVAGAAEAQRERGQLEAGDAPTPPASGSGFPLWAVVLAVALYCGLFWSGVSWLVLSLV